MEFIKEQKLPHYSFKEEYLGELSNFENLQVRLYVAENNLEGYYLIFENKKVVFSNKGRMKHIDGLYEQQMDIYEKLFKIQRKENQF